MKIISCAGFGGTGSSIVTDFFREFSNVYSVGGNGLEFFLLHEPDGIKDLENALVEGHRFKVDFAIKRFKKLIENLNYHNPSGPNYKEFFNGKFLKITNEYLDSLGIIEWQEGFWHRIFEGNENKVYRFIKNLRFQKHVKKYYSLYEPDDWKPMYTGYATQYYCNITREDFILKTKTYLIKLFSEIKTDAEYLLFDQLFPPAATEYMDYFDNAKAIVVERDPRDLYFANKVFWGLGFIPFKDIDTFIGWFKNTRNTIKESENVCLVKFEDFLYETEKTTKKIINFIGIDQKNHNKTNTFFFPEKSITNTQLYRKYVLENTSIQNRMLSNINMIETNLKEYLYDFDSKADGAIEIENKIQKFIYEQEYENIKKENIFFSIFFDIPSICIYILNKIKRMF